jgi:serine/threonine-protein kinase
MTVRTSMPETCTPRRRAPAILAASLSIAVMLGQGTARAAATDVAAAQGLFDNARTLMKAGQYAQACPKLEESQRLDHSASTEFQLADCYEHVGRAASAWALFLQVASESRAKGNADAERIAHDRAGKLAPKLAHLTVTVPAATRVGGLQVKRDDEVVGDGQWATPVPVDAGPHTVTATAPGYATWTKTVSVADGDAPTVDVPALAVASGPTGGPTVVAPPVSPDLAPGAPLGSEPAPSDSPHRMNRRTLGLIVGGVGVATTVVGAVFGVVALSDNSDSKSNCTGNVCKGAGYTERNDAVAAGNVSSVLIGIGAAAIVTGGVLWFTAPRKATPQQAVTLNVGPTSFLIGGQF